MLLTTAKSSDKWAHNKFSVAFFFYWKLCLLTNSKQICFPAGMVNIKLDHGTHKLVTKYFRHLYGLLLVIFWDFHEVIVCLIYFRLNRIEALGHCKFLPVTDLCLLVPENLKLSGTAWFPYLVPHVRALQDLKFLIPFLVTLNNFFFHVEMKILRINRCLAMAWKLYVHKAVQLVCSSTLGGRMNSKALGLIADPAHRWQYLVQNAVVKGLLEF